VACTWPQGAGQHWIWFACARLGPSPIALLVLHLCRVTTGFRCWCAGRRLSQGTGQGAQAPTPNHRQAFFSRVIMLVFTSLHILLAGLCALLSMPNMLFSRFPTCLRAAAMLAMLSLSCWHLASGHDKCVCVCARGCLRATGFTRAALTQRLSGRDIGHPNIPSLRVARGGQSQCMALSKPPAL
jgi:hypothetical protein